MNRNKTGGFSPERLRRMVAGAMFVALAYVSVLILPVRVSFLTLDIKTSVIAMAAMCLGPVSGAVISLVTALVEMITISDTGMYGMIMNFLGSASFAVTASLIYRRQKSFLSAVLSLLSGCVAMISVMLLANLVITPFYMGATVADVMKLIPTLLFPFNLVKGVLNAALTMMFYKPLTMALERAKLIEKPEETHFTKKTVYVTAVSCVICIVCVLVLVFVMDASYGT